MRNINKYVLSTYSETLTVLGAEDDLSNNHLLSWNFHSSGERQTVKMNE